MIDADYRQLDDKAHVAQYLRLLADWVNDRFVRKPDPTDEAIEHLKTPRG